MSKAIAEKENNAMVSQQAMDLVYGDIDAGTEEFDRNEVIIPTLHLMQAISPQVMKTDSAYIKGAEVGDFVNTATGKLYSGEEGIVLVPITKRHTFIERTTKKEGDKFLIDHGNNVELYNTAEYSETEKRNILPNGNVIVEVFEYFCFIVDESTNSFEPIVVRLKGSQRESARRWNTLMSGIRVETPKGPQRPRIYYMSYKAKATTKSNEENTWYVPKFENYMSVLNFPNGEAMYIAAREFAEQVSEGLVTASDEPSSVHDEEAI